MWLKIVIVFLFLAVLASLSSALFFLLRDMGAPESKRTLYALGIRITLATLLLLAIWYGFDSGLLSNTAPWADKY
ncbi:DUF2909 domain-containing protein [Microbulbifer thermotolerans]|uniref:DUF2909 domain-containing protein n=1 Tax=Microbulbifer thermotolerans TaxID=252514 RepID=UPI00224B8458|nr:DUF2909 domain-containing protein [Microbulbifer thermotolerans]MCX2783938.1 DUF2909 domain-containing protein [Microbulbifer thermotolerans]